MRFETTKHYAWVDAYFEPRDLWVGAYWRFCPESYTAPPALTVYVCLLPCLPIRIYWEWLR